MLAMLVAVACFAAMDSLLKLLSEHYAALQVAFIRGAAALPFVLVPILLRDRLARLKPVNLRLHLLRGVLSIVMLFSFVRAVRESSLASTYAIFMCAPLLVAALSAPMLGEKVAGQQWWAIGVGLAGVLLMLGPATGQWATAGALWALLAVAGYTLSVVTLRILARTDTNESMVFWFTAMLAVGAGLLSIPGWRGLQWTHGPIMAGVGLCGALGQHFITVAFRSAPAATVTPFEYTALVWGVLLDVAIWSVWPSMVTLLGGGIVIGAGLYLIDRERRTSIAARVPGA
ncbi:MAG TPA: DMT family transporter [Steroidobacteraceae bacterium]|nr:DMT family transporter [Steroidobacteraceae bacterium]